jgi:hypothetical protein
VVFLLLLFTADITNIIQNLSSSPFRLPQQGGGLLLLLMCKLARSCLLLSAFGNPLVRCWQVFAGHGIGAAEAVGFAVRPRD